MTAIGKGNVEVIGALIDQLVAGGGTGEPGTGFVPLLDWSGDWTLGTVPSRIECTVDGHYLPSAAARRSFLSPNTPKRIRIGDGQAGVEISDLWISTADPDQWDASVAQIKVVMQDRRAWWHTRPPYGPRAYNTEQFAQRLSPFAPGSGAIYGSNPSYSPTTLRTGRQIITEIFAYLGESAGNVHLTGGHGFANLSTIYSPGGIAVLDDTPVWVVGDGATPVEALEKFCAMYDLIVALSIDSMRVGFIRAADIPEKIDRTKGEIEALLKLQMNPVEAGSIGTDREHLPDIICIEGSPFVIGDYLTLEPVCRDPDRPEYFIPLFRIETLEAYGFNMSKLGRRHLTDGQGAIRFATAIAACVDAPAEVPARFHSYLKEWFRIWQVAMPRMYATKPASRDERLIEENHGGFNYRRWASPRYAFVRGQDGGTPTDTGWSPSATSRTIHPGRWLPLLPHTEGMTQDGSYEKLRVLGANVLRPAQIGGMQGDEGWDWVGVGGSIAPDAMSFQDLTRLGLEPGLLDPELGIVDLGEQVFGHDGQPGGTKTATYLLSQHGTSMIDLWSREFLAHRARAGLAPGGGGTPVEIVPAPLGQACLVLHCSYHAKSHGDALDTASTYSIEPPGRSDAYSSVAPVQNGMREHVTTGTTIGGIEPDGARAHPLVSYQTGLPDLELRCMTSRRRTSFTRSLEPKQSFERDGGWASGALTGTCYYGDMTLAAPSRLVSDPDDGWFTYATAEHYGDIMREITDCITRINEGIKKFRQSGNGITAVNAEIHGVWRRFFPGVAEFADHPVDSVGFSGSGDGVTARMRVAANSRGWRPYVESAMARASAALARHRASAAAIHSVMRGGGI